MSKKVTTEESLKRLMKEMDMLDAHAQLFTEGSFKIRQLIQTLLNQVTTTDPERALKMAGMLAKRHAHIERSAAKARLKNGQ